MTKAQYSNTAIIYPHPAICCAPEKAKAFEVRTGLQIAVTLSGRAQVFPRNSGEA